MTILSTFQDIRTSLLRDRRNLNIILTDSDLNISPILAPDCSDIIQFIHIKNPDKLQSDAYSEGIRRYFVKADHLILVPAWVYEFLHYMHRVIVQNIEKYGFAGGLDKFVKKYPMAYEFKKLWSGGRYSEAQELYNNNETWVQILSLTNDEIVDEMLGNTIRRFNYLANSKKFIPINEYVHENKNLGYEKLIYDSVNSELKKERPDPSEIKKNEVDARSFSTICWVNNYLHKNLLTAVTSAKMPLKAFYYALDEIFDNTAQSISYARSPITLWVKELVQKLGDESTKFIKTGIYLIDEILRTLPTVQEQYKQNFFSDKRILNIEDIDKIKIRGELQSIFETYFNHYRIPIFKQIEKLGSQKHRYHVLAPEEAATILSPEIFERKMKNARKILKSEPKHMVEIARSYVKPAESTILSGKKLGSLVKEIEKDFRKDVF